MAEDGPAEGPPDAGATGDPLARLAAERDLSREELLAELFDAPDRIASVAERLEDLEDDVDAKIQDVRERVIQVKREADAKAPAEHDHPELAERLDRIADDLGELEGRLADLEGDVDEGFENYEALLEHLLEASAAADRKRTTLASALLDLRERTDALAEAAARRGAVATLAAEANRQGVRQARCEDCGERVDVGLLREPSCPHCDAQFSGVTATRGFFGSSTLETGTPPALEPGDDEGDAVDLDGVLESGGDPPGDVLDDEGDGVDEEGSGPFGTDGHDGEDADDAGDLFDDPTDDGEDADEADETSTDGGRASDGWDWVGNG